MASEKIRALMDKGVTFPTLREAGYSYRVDNAYNFDNTELAELAKQFRVFDLLGDDRITCREAKIALKRFGLSALEKELQEVINKVDPFGKGLFSFQQFVDVAKALRNIVMTEAEVVEAFKIFDRDGTGKVHVSELMHVMTSIGDRMTQAEAEAMIKDAAEDKGAVDYVTFAKVAMKSL
jgi:calmodulin